MPVTIFPFSRLITRLHAAALVLLVLACTSLPGCSALPKNLTPQPLAALTSSQTANDDKIRQAALADPSFPTANQPAPKTANIEHRTSNIEH